MVRFPRRSAIARAAPLLLLLAGPVAAQDAPPMLRPGERIVFPDVAFSMLGLNVQRHQRGTNVTLRLRGQTGDARSVMVGLDGVRLLAAGVPREPVHDTVADRQMSSFIIERDSAADFTGVFRIPDLTDDLVLQLRVDGMVERRRLPAT